MQNKKNALIGFSPLKITKKDSTRFGRSHLRHSFVASYNHQADDFYILMEQKDKEIQKRHRRRRKKSKIANV